MQLLNRWWLKMSQSAHPRYESIYPDDFWKLAICPYCHTVLYKYQTKEGKIFCVSVLPSFQFLRYGNNNNYVAPHNCGTDISGVLDKEKLHVGWIEPSEEVKEKVIGSIQQQAVMKALTEFSKPRIRSTFKKSMLEQAQKFLRGKTGYKNPFSPKQAISIVGVI